LLFVGLLLPPFRLWLLQPLLPECGLLGPEKEKSIELRAEPEQDVALLLFEKPQLSLPKDVNETAELGGSVAESLLIRLRFAQRISTPPSPSEVSPLLVV
jgi:hypothetical protein